jgi:hypothetical protein
MQLAPWVHPHLDNFALEAHDDVLKGRYRQLNVAATQCGKEIAG